MLTEKDMQHAVYDYRSNIGAFPIMVPNIYLWHWESDLLYLSRANYVTEFEIKRTRSDFRADSKKQSKHWQLQNGRGPAEFYYVCPKDIISVEELPEYAGLMYVQPRMKGGYYYDGGWLSRYEVRVVRRAERQKVDPLNNSQIRTLLEKGVSRYWSIQRHITNKQEESQTST